MGEIPQDVWEIADATHFACFEADDADEEVNIIARAILAERERCAAKADTWADDLQRFEDNAPHRIMRNFAAALRAPVVALSTSHQPTQGEAS